MEAKGVCTLQERRGESMCVARLGETGRAEEREKASVRRGERRQDEAGSIVDVNFIICGISRVAAAEQEASVPVDYHACPLNAPGCCISIRVRSGLSSAEKKAAFSL